MTHVIHSNSQSPLLARLDIDVDSDCATVAVHRIETGSETQGAVGTFSLAEIRKALEPPKAKPKAEPVKSKPQAHKPHPPKEKPKAHPSPAKPAPRAVRKS